MAGEVNFRDIPGEGTHETDSVVFKTRVNTAWQHYLDKTGIGAQTLHVSPVEAAPASDVVASESGGKRARGKAAELSLDERAAQYGTQEPLFGFDQLIVPDSVKSNLVLAARIIDLERRVFDEWGLR